MPTKNLLLVGVGGQGILLGGKIVADVALRLGRDVKLTEIHGMAQRGGSVVTQIRIGEKIHSPLIEPGQADYIVAFEQLEALRWLHYLRPTGTMILSTQKIMPMTVLTGAAPYPEEGPARVSSKAAKTIELDALAMAQDLGNTRVVNTILLGALAKEMEIDKEYWLKALEAALRPQFLDLNKRAFTFGYGI